MPILTMKRNPDHVRSWVRGAIDGIRLRRRELAETERNLVEMMETEGMTAAELALLVEVRDEGKVK